MVLAGKLGDTTRNTPPEPIWATGTRSRVTLYAGFLAMAWLMTVNEAAVSSSV